MRYALIIGFVLMVIAQWYAPLSLVFAAQGTIDDGAEYLFRTEPVDPSDPFRGKYVTLSFNEEMYHASDSIELNIPDNSTVYAILGVDSVGYAKIMQLRTDPPTENVDYAAVTYVYAAGSDETIYLKFPFSRFYMEESKASEAERLYWQSRFDSSMVSYAKVKVLNGDTKLVDVMVNDSSIVDVVRRINANKDKGI